MPGETRAHHERYGHAREQTHRELHSAHEAIAAGAYEEGAALHGAVASQLDGTGRDAELARALRGQGLCCYNLERFGDAERLLRQALDIRV